MPQMPQVRKYKVIYENNAPLIGEAVVNPTTRTVEYKPLGHDQSIFKFWSNDTKKKAEEALQQFAEEGKISTQLFDHFASEYNVEDDDGFIYNIREALKKNAMARTNSALLSREHVNMRPKSRDNEALAEKKPSKELLGKEALKQLIENKPSKELAEGKHSKELIEEEALQQLGEAKQLPIPEAPPSLDKYYNKGKSFKEDEPRYHSNVPIPARHPQFAEDFSNDESFNSENIPLLDKPSDLNEQFNLENIPRSNEAFRIHKPFKEDAFVENGMREQENYENEISEFSDPNGLINQDAFGPALIHSMRIADAYSAFENPVANKIEPVAEPYNEIRSYSKTITNPIKPDPIKPDNTWFSNGLSKVGNFVSANKLPIAAGLATAALGGLLIKHLLNRRKKKNTESKKLQTLHSPTLNNNKGENNHALYNPYKPRKKY